MFHDGGLPDVNLDSSVHVHGHDAMADAKVAQDLLSIPGWHAQTCTINKPLDSLGNNWESLLQSRSGASPDRRS
eukprot:3424689-Alexandrium_andersonii.AAC.1